MLSNLDVRLFMSGTFMVLLDRVLDAFLLSFFIIFTAVQLETKEGRLLYAYSTALFLYLITL